MKHKIIDQYYKGNALNAYELFGAHLCEERGKKGVRFNVFAPHAQSIQVIGSFNDWSCQGYMMKRADEKGIWTLFIPGVKEGDMYKYRITQATGRVVDKMDPYAFYSELRPNTASIVVNLEYKKWSDEKWISQRDKNFDKPLNIYEVHLGSWKKEEGQEWVNYKTIAKELIAYVKKQNFTHIELMPLNEYPFDGSWGYQCSGYFSATSRYGSCQDLMYLINACHKAGIGVIMDVVYNHTYSSYSSPFQLSVPAYYYRMHDNGSFQDGSGCGNETASEKEMYRKYMIDSLTYWAEEFGVDGFRFDLMGLHDVETMKAVRSAMDDIDPRILLYGEGWDMGIGLPVDQKAKKDNAALMPRIGFFNDNARDAVKGAEVYGHISNGYVSGAPLEDQIAKSLLGSRGFVNYLMPGQVLNYIEAHDNYNLNDLMHHLHPHDSPEDIEKRIYLANALNLTMQGMCFMQLGQEFQRSKMVATGEDGNYTEADVKRAMNSYNAPDAVNQVDWNQVTLKKDLVAKVAKLIERKQTVQEFSYRSYADIYDNLYVAKAEYDSGIVELHISGKLRKTFVFDNMKKDLEIY